MIAYDEISDLYKFDELETFNPVLHKSILAIDGVNYKGNSFTTPSQKNVFVFRTEGTMGNHWNLYDIDYSKYLLIGRRTKRQTIEDAGRL
ncbi:hypothetical protein [Bacillus sp. AG4(2022)]|uniref:hypothetical protein n=1 Tax=Bacillus sp. AG4(2022) TaxID=2962594 RepID=UPI002882C0B8|nr:hypothetical protein [Bacillus sp. AG4(2022)]MDT0160315.1 hypothetical protein [Bacillus sp. AG4(2022)]